MRTFTCAACGQTLYFENSQCTRCGRAVVFLPDRRLLSVVDLEGPPPSATLVAVGVGGADRYRPCGNQIDHQACNWAVAARDDQRFCLSCRMNVLIPNLAEPGAKDAWLRLERGKRRLLYTLMDLGLPLDERQPDRDGGLRFSFKSDEPGADKVLTGHSDGLITINVVEADGTARERTREALGEPYRTVLGHFRHESGHYFWSRLVDGSSRAGEFRDLFGDPGADYALASKRHYEQGPPTDWPARFVSAYASMHPWEDWAETWAHYLHMIDTLETAASFGIAVRARPVEGAPGPNVVVPRVDSDDFQGLVTAWVSLTLALNSLNRSMGLPDPYPFVLPEPAVWKLRFVHAVVADARRRWR
ncbi:MAG TPA: putative zinc-binding metallopeptidase [Polyangia bacterium]|nr:putative zinc-binding metallopeptidase [Polyangia bacterium]